MADRPVLSFLRCASRMRCRSARSSSGTRVAAARVQQLVLQFITVAQDGGQWRDEPVDVELLRKCALAVARDEQTDGLQRTERVTDRPAADAEPFGKRAFRGQSLARREGAVEN